LFYDISERKEFSTMLETSTAVTKMDVTIGEGKNATKVRIELPKVQATNPDGTLIDTTTPLCSVTYQLPGTDKMEVIDDPFDKGFIADCIVRGLTLSGQSDVRKSMTDAVSDFLAPLPQPWTDTQIIEAAYKGQSAGRAFIMANSVDGLFRPDRISRRPRATTSAVNAEKTALKTALTAMIANIDPATLTPELRAMLATAGIAI
jgi:hypothetical protein